VYLVVVNKASCHVWVFLQKLKEPPLDIVQEFLQIHSLKDGGVIFVVTKEENW